MEEHEEEEEEEDDDNNIIRGFAEYDAFGILQWGKLKKR
jgi:hypothetical protein